MGTVISSALIGIVLFLAAGSAVAQEYDAIEVGTSGEHLYSTDLEVLDRLDSVTIFITEGKQDKEIEKAFFEFARLIGSYNGATRVNIYDFKRYSELLARFGCRPLHSEDVPAVVFSAKKMKYCQVFPLSDSKALIEVLLTIQRNMKCPGDLAVDRVARDTRRAVNALADSLPQTKGLQRPAGELIAFIAEHLRTTCQSTQATTRK